MILSPPLFAALQNEWHFHLTLSQSLSNLFSFCLIPNVIWITRSRCWTTPVYPSELRASLKSLCHTRSGVTRVLGARGQKQWSAPPIFSGGRTGPECKMLCSRVPKQVGNQTSKLGCDRPLLAHSANFIVPTFVFVSHKIFSAKAVLRPLACCARGQLPPPVSYANA